MYQRYGKQEEKIDELARLSVPCASNPDTYRARRDDFYTQLIRKGIFLHPHHHGYICYRHTEEDLDRAAKAIDEAMAYVKEKYSR